MAAQQQPSPVLNEVFTRAVLDDDFRTRLFDERKAALSEYALSDRDWEYLDRVSREQFSQTAKELREGSVSGAVIAIGIGIFGHFNVDAAPPSE
jgi:hypothetical protein